MNEKECAHCHRAIPATEWRRVGNLDAHVGCLGVVEFEALPGSQVDDLLKLARSAMVSRIGLPPTLPAEQIVSVLQEVKRSRNSSLTNR
jgi:hypothetical protein